jgi:hypothetical protein
LHKKDRLLRINATGKKVDHHLAGIPKQVAGLVWHGHGVEIYNAVDTLMVFLQLNPIGYGTEIVADVNDTGRLYSGENALAFLHLGLVLTENPAPWIIAGAGLQR